MKSCIQTEKMHKILVITLYFPLDALYVSDCIRPSQGATFISCTSRLVYAVTIRLAVLWLYLVIRLYFPLDALHVSDYISPSSGATL